MSAAIGAKSRPFAALRMTRLKNGPVDLDGSLLRNEIV
jgi:hypothetical protein